MHPMVWLGLGYNVPTHPSKNRVYVWRKLKEMGARYFKPGVAILPKAPQSQAKFAGLAGKIREMGGEATLIELRFLDKGDEKQTVDRFRKQSESEYWELLRDCAGLLGGAQGSRPIPTEQAEHLRKVVKRYGKVKSRDYFRSRSQGDIATALGDLANDMAGVTDEIGHQLQNILDL